MAFILLGNFTAFILLPIFGVTVSFIGTIVGGFGIGVAASYFVGSIFKDFEENKLFGKTMAQIRESYSYLDLEVNLNMDYVHEVVAKSDIGCFKDRNQFNKYYEDMLEILSVYIDAITEEKAKEELLLITEEAQISKTSNNNELKVLNMSFE